ncbi:MAG: NYN domain-containing protein [Candidatus Coatesbacteria bacterium]|nr:MAG: NYN domain-containing protein [Candidatus Coatesbacteria bacterium]
MMDLNNERNIGVFIDYEYLHITLERLYGIVLKPELIIAGVRNKVSEYGKIILERAYAPWSNFVDGLAKLSKSRVETINITSKQVDKTDLATGRRCSILQNNADIYIAWDIAQLIFSNQNIDTFVIVTGDSDFIEIVKRVQQNGRRVAVVGFRDNTSDLLRTQADTFISLDDLASANESAILDRVIDLCLDLENKLNYVGYKLVMDILIREEPNVNFRDIIQRAINDGVFFTERRPEPDSVKGEVFVLKTNLSHPAAQGVIAKRKAEGKPVPVETAVGDEPGARATRNHDDPRFVDAVNRISTGDSAGALERFEEYLTDYPNDLSAYVSSIKCLVELNDSEKLPAMCKRARAVENYEQQRDHFPDWAEFIESKSYGESSEVVVTE